MDAPTATLLGGLAVGLGLAFHEFFFFGALLVFAAWAVPHAFQREPISICEMGRTISRTARSLIPPANGGFFHRCHPEARRR
jgi:hypothetical protein